MTYKDRLEKLKSLDRFINGKYQDDIILILDKSYSDDKWSIICAVMHWFNVVEKHLDSEHLLEEKTDDYNWGKVYLYITAVDIVTKGINNLNKIITNSDKRLFKAENNIFNDKIKDDNEYFQNIRAIFGAHPTDLNGNFDYIVATYPTPYDKTIDVLKGEEKNWDYYTLLWSKEKADYLKQESFGFRFEDINNYLDKHIQYLDNIYNKFINIIENYKKEKSSTEIKRNDDPVEQLRILKEEDKIRLNGKYDSLINDLIILLNTNITDEFNKKEYLKFKIKLIEKIPLLFNAIQKPNDLVNLNEIENIIDCEMPKHDNMTSYYYSKLLEYESNNDMNELLIVYFKDKIKPFNPNISGKIELFCLVTAHKYFLNKNHYNE